MNKLIQTLQQEEDKLLNKLQKANNENNFGDYKMLIRTLTEVSRLKNDEIKANNLDKKLVILFSKEGYELRSNGIKEVVTEPIIDYENKVIGYNGFIRLTNDFKDLERLIVIDNSNNEFLEINNIKYNNGKYNFKVKDSIIIERCK